MSHSAGLDWSGSPEQPVPGGESEYYVPACVVCDQTDAEAFLVRHRARHGIRQDQEIKGYKSSDEQLAAIIDYALLNATVTAMIVDKTLLAESYGSQLFSKPAELPPATGLAVLNHAFSASVFGALYTDLGDIAADRYAAFRVAARHRLRLHQGDESRRIDIKAVKSHKSSLIQLADVVAYALHRQQHGGMSTVGKSMCRKLWKLDRNRIWFGNAADLQPYLVL